MTESSDMSRGRARALLTAITLLGLCVRTVEMDALLPSLLEPDADFVRQALTLREYRSGKIADLGGMLPDYPLLLPWLLSWLPITPPSPGVDAPLSEHLAVAAAPFLWGRWLVALLSLVFVPATYAMSRAVLSRRAALMASAFAATSLTHVLYAQQARPHAVYVALVPCALAACLHLRRRGGWSAHLLAALACGLALACLHFGLFLLPAFSLAAWLAARRSPVQLGVGLALLLLVAWWAYPSAAGTSGLDVEGGALGLTGHRLRFDKFHGRGFWIIPWLAVSHEPVLTLLLVLALGLALLRRLRGAPLVQPKARADLAVLAAYGLPYWLVLGAFDHAWDKYGLPLLPLACLFAAAASERLWAGVRARPALSWAACAMLLLVPCVASARFALLRLRTDSVERASDWLRANARREHEGVLLHHGLSLPLARRTPAHDPVPSWALGVWDLHQREHPELQDRGDLWRIEHLHVPAAGAMPGRAVLEQDVLEEALARSDARWVVLERRGAWQASGDRSREAVIAVGAELSASFEPYDPSVVTLDSRGWVLGDQATLRALTARYPGPRLEIWRLPEPR